MCTSKKMLSKDNSTDTDKPTTTSATTSTDNTDTDSTDTCGNSSNSNTDKNDRIDSKSVSPTNISDTDDEEHSKTATEIILDMAFLRPKNVTKLFTKEDGRFAHVHKIIGCTALAHYIYRYYLLVTTGSMKFDNSFFTLGCIFLHMLLSASSFIFRIPNRRMSTAPMIYPEFRLHSIIFAYRSLIIMLLMWGASRYDIVLPLYFRGAVILLTMVLADCVTNA